MKKLTFFFISMTLLNANIICGQNKMPDHTYDRIALTVIYADDPNPGSNMTGTYREAAREFYSTSSIVPSKYDSHALQTKVIECDLSGKSNGNSDAEKLLSAVNEAKIPRQMVERWFQRSEDGVFTMDLIKERGRYNATDNDYLSSVATERQTSVLEDMGEKLLKKSYLLLINNLDIQSLKKSDGSVYYQGSAMAYVFRLVWDEATSSMFYNDLWINEKDQESVIKQKREMFNNTDFKVEFVSSVNVTKDQLIIPGLKLMSDPQKLQLLNAQLGEGIINNLEKVNSEFIVKQYLTASNPPAATIGSKEGLYVDQRFFVYETKANADNQLKDKRRSVVRVRKISDNTFESQGKTDPSVFYRVAGGKIDHYGMFLKQKNDKGISLSVVNLVGGVGGLEITGTYNLSSLLSKSLKINTSPGIHFYGEYGFDSGYYSDVAYTGNANYKFGRFSVGLLKDYYFGKIFHTSVKLGYGMENTELTNNQEVEDQVNFSGQFGLAGTRLGINLLHNVQLVAGVNYYIPFGKATLKYGTDKPQKQDNGYTYYFNDRKGLTILAGLKIII